MGGCWERIWGQTCRKVWDLEKCVFTFKRMPCAGDRRRGEEGDAQEMEGDAHLGDAHLGPELKAYEPDRWLMGVQAQALALMSQFSSDRDSFWARGLYELVEL